MSRFDVVIIGGGAAGLSGALVLGRARRRVAVVDAGNPRNAPAAHMQGFLGSDGLPPRELLAAGRAEIAGYGVELIAGTATAIAAAPRSAGEPGFQVQLADGASLSTRRVLVTTGLRDEIPDLPGARERWDVTCCTAPTVTATKSATGVWPSSEHRSRRSPMRSWCVNGHPT